jgi:hypothetical protein
MSAKFTLILIFGLFAMATGWQLALYFPPDEWRFAGWIVAGIGVLGTGLAASRGG